MITTLQKPQGFTIIEAIVSLAIFAIAFSGLYFFFGMAHQAYNNSEKRMHLNLMANHILETIHAEAYRDDADVANPFVTPASYTANLSDCSTYTAPDVRHTWCTELNASVGPHKGVHADEVRTVEVVKDEAYLIANVSLVVDAGIGEKNLIKTFLSRKIAAPRRSTPHESCLENHNELAAHVQSEITKCSAGTIPFIEFKRTAGVGYWSAPTSAMQVSCPDYKLQTSPGLPALSPYRGAILPSLPWEMRTLWIQYIMERYEDSTWPVPGNVPTVYGTSPGGGSIWRSHPNAVDGLAGLMSIEYIEGLHLGLGGSWARPPSPHPFCNDPPGPESMRNAGIKCDSAGHVTVVSCCPAGTNADGVYNACFTPVFTSYINPIRSKPDTEPFTMTTITFP